MTKKVKIITHNAHFHGDEVFACAIIKYFFGSIEVIRTRNKELIDLHKDDENVFVIDLGLEYRPTKRNFDHHQDLTLKSSAGLVWDYYSPHYLKQSVIERVDNELIKSVDWMDVNKYEIFSKLDNFNSSFPEKIKYLGISKVISLMNRDPSDDNMQIKQFLKAVDFAYDVLSDFIYNANEILKDDISWKNRMLYKNFAYIFDLKCDTWMEKRIEENFLINYVIQPRVDGYGIRTVDAKKFPLPTEEELIENVGKDSFTFAHRARFLITCKNLSSVYRILDYMIEKNIE